MLAWIFCISQVVLATGWLNVTAFYPLYVDKTFGKEIINSKMTSIAMCSAELAGVVLAPLHAIVIPAVGKKNAITLGFVLNIIAVASMGLLAYIDKLNW